MSLTLFILLLFVLLALIDGVSEQTSWKLQVFPCLTMLAVLAAELVLALGTRAG